MAETKEFTIKPFVTSFHETPQNPGQRGLLHIYFYAGKDKAGKPLAKMHFVSRDVNYRFTKKEDGAIDYAIINEEELSNGVEVEVTYIDSSEKTTHTFR